MRIPGPEAKGAIIGFGDVHTRAHVYRAILEGLAYALREGGERTAKRTKVPLRRRCASSGGGAQTPAAVQLTADIFGLPVARGRTPTRRRGSGRPSTRPSGLGIHRDIETAVRRDVHVAEVRDPDPADHARYDDLYRTGLPPDVRAAFEPLYAEIRAITGYPPGRR